MGKNGKFLDVAVVGAVVNAAARSKLVLSYLEEMAYMNTHNRMDS